LRPTKVSQKQTLPFTDEEVDRLLVAARALGRFRSYGPKMEPMILLLRWQVDTGTDVPRFITMYPR
jgi:hypothetical protein